MEDPDISSSSSPAATAGAGPEGDAARWEREFTIKRRDLELREQQFDLERKQAMSHRMNPLVAAVLAAALAAVSNAAVMYINGRQQRELEDKKTQNALVLAMLSAGGADHAAENLQFLLSAGLLTDPVLSSNLRAYLAKRAKGEGPWLKGSGADYYSSVPSFNPNMDYVETSCVGGATCRRGEGAGEVGSKRPPSGGNSK